MMLGYEIYLFRMQIINVLNVNPKIAKKSLNVNKILKLPPRNS